LKVGSECAHEEIAALFDLSFNEAIYHAAIAYRPHEAEGQIYLELC
jgi:hypothetical protein